MTNAAWADAAHAIRLSQCDPTGLGGVWLRARLGPPRDRFIDLVLAEAQLPVVKISPTMTDDALYGGLDVTQTLLSGSPVFTKGVLGQGPRVLLLTSAERLSPHMAARLSSGLEQGGGHLLIALDESAEDEAPPPSSLTDRLAFHVSLEGLSVRDCEPIQPGQSGAGTILGTDEPAMDDPARSLTILSARLGVPGLRAPQLALRAARAAAKLAGHSDITQANLELAARLVIGPRATVLPVDQPLDDPAPPPPMDEPGETDGASENQPQIPDDILLEATLAALPRDLLASLAERSPTRNAAGASTHGAMKKSLTRGRPLPPRKGKPDGRNRIDLIATLRSAAPWQTLRRSQSPGDSLKIRAGDIHIRRYQSRSDRLLVFAVDASGSAAMNRLAEAKGAVELLLADAYASRDHVTLIAFNKESAEQLLPPTRSLVRAKRELAILPGGGGTPLAAGIGAAIEVAEQSRRKGFQPALVLIADGRPNIDLDGQPNRASALADAMTTAKRNTAQGLLIDISKRPESQLKQIADVMGVTYTVMPYVDASGFSSRVKSELGQA